MTTLKIGVLCPSEIAFRRFMPSLNKIQTCEFIGIGIASEEEWFGNTSLNNDLSIITSELTKAEAFVTTYGGQIFKSYMDLVTSPLIDAVYIPLPPALHHKWAKIALTHGKHVFVEKPSTISIEDSTELVEIASKKKLALCENYMFTFHSQLEFIQKMITSGEIGEVRLFRISFGFPFRGIADFRYNKQLGGGALLDCGGYTLKLATILLGNTIELTTKQLNYVQDIEVDVYGSASLKNYDNQVAQISFGMDNDYKCDLEIWGSKGILYTNRILTAPENYKPTVTIKCGLETKEIVLEADDAFKKSIEHFVLCVNDELLRTKTYKEIVLQSSLVDEFMKQ